MGGMNWTRLIAIKGAMNHAKTPFSTEICAGAIISGIQYLAPLQYHNATNSKVSVSCAKGCVPCSTLPLNIQMLKVSH
jgi:hypothetical protein